MNYHWFNFTITHSGVVLLQKPKTRECTTMTNFGSTNGMSTTMTIFSRKLQNFNFSAGGKSKRKSYSIFLIFFSIPPQFLFTKTRRIQTRGVDLAKVNEKKKHAILLPHFAFSPFRLFASLSLFSLLSVHLRWRFGPDAKVPVAISLEIGRKSRLRWLGVHNHAMVEEEAKNRRR